MSCLSFCVETAKRVADFKSWFACYHQRLEPTL
jgi:hypothetical protein